MTPQPTLLGHCILCPLRMTRGHLSQTERKSAVSRSVLATGQLLASRSNSELRRRLNPTRIHEISLSQ